MIRRHMVRQCLPGHHFQTTLEGVLSFCQLGHRTTTESEMSGGLSNSKTVHILVISWHTYLLAQTIKYTCEQWQ